MAFPQLGDTIDVWMDGPEGTPVHVVGELVAIRPKGQDVTVLTRNGDRVRVPFRNIVDRYGD